MNSVCKSGRFSYLAKTDILKAGRSRHEFFFFQPLYGRRRGILDFDPIEGAAGPRKAFRHDTLVRPA
jgi:hypothetical protein